MGTDLKEDDKNIVDAPDYKVTNVEPKKEEGAEEPKEETGYRDSGESREPREQREPYEPRDHKEPRDSIDYRDLREYRDPREYRDLRNRTRRTEYDDMYSRMDRFDKNRNCRDIEADYRRRNGYSTERYLREKYDRDTGERYPYQVGRLTTGQKILIGVGIGCAVLFPLFIFLVLILLLVSI